MDRRYVEASAVSLGLFAVWWVGIRRLDGALASRLPYHRYETVALLYPDVYYPALPGWVLAQLQPYGAGVWAVALGWMLVLSLAVGAGATAVAADRNLDPTRTAAAAVGASFVLLAVVEAAAV